MIQWGTNEAQTTVIGTLEDIGTKARTAGAGSPATVVIGEVVSLSGALDWYRALPAPSQEVAV